MSPAGSTRSSATSELGSAPTIVAGTWLWSSNCTYTWRARRMSAPSPLVTTCALVAISPFDDTTKPDPRPAPPPWGASGLALPANSLITVTTPGERAPVDRLRVEVASGQRLERSRPGSVDAGGAWLAVVDELPLPPEPPQPARASAASAAAGMPRAQLTPAARR